MATNPKALELARQGKIEYEWGTLWPHYHKEKMNWGGGFRTKVMSTSCFCPARPGAIRSRTPHAGLPRRNGRAEAR